MFGCIGRLVVLCALLLVGAVAYVTRDRWMPGVMAHLPGQRVRAASWQPVTPAGAARARAAIDTLARPTGQAFVNVTPADLAAYALEPVLARLVPAGKDVAGPEARADVGLLLVRGSVRIADLGGAAALGPLAGILDGTQKIEVRGSLDVPQPGRAYFVVTRVSVGDLVLPGAAIGRVVQQIAPRKDKAQSEAAVLLALPASVADVRIRPGRATLYKAAK
ncbi:MAG TPA: hypothetical protein VG916_08810 [Gemmatimonadaceae bacterium]|nr:hypothetical protein [Gemmatimonadaceae bacterium]